MDRPFGGVNVLFCGDFYQLEPPSGTAINALPTSYLKKARKYAPGATEDHGQHIFWGAGGEWAVQGMTELTECKRLEDHDEWFLGVQDEFRRGALTERTHNFLHGRPTDVSGSWVDGAAQCGDVRCRENATAISKNNGLECDACKCERFKRKLVATTPEDARFREEKFVEAVAIYANQDIRCHVGKQRAVQWAKERGEQLLWVAARDRPCHGGDQRRPYTVEDKVRWLGYHDKECASLPGWLPLAKGMPVALGDHLDRSKKQLLRGRAATIHGWVLHEDEILSLIHI